VRARRPIILNGISIVPEKSDLLDRCLPIGLLPPKAGDDEEGVVKSREDDDLKVALEAVRPAVLGAVFTALATALRNYDATVVPDAPRIRNKALARWAIAAEPGLGKPACGAVCSLPRADPPLGESLLRQSATNT
jgi:hypothetical protein